MPTLRCLVALPDVSKTHEAFDNEVQHQLKDAFESATKSMKVGTVEGPIFKGEDTSYWKEIDGEVQSVPDLAFVPNAEGWTKAIYLRYEWEVEILDAKPVD